MQYTTNTGCVYDRIMREYVKPISAPPPLHMTSDMYFDWVMSHCVNIYKSPDSQLILLGTQQCPPPSGRGNQDRGEEVFQIWMAKKGTTNSSKEKKREMRSPGVFLNQLNHLNLFLGAKHQRKWHILQIYLNNWRIFLLLFRHHSSIIEVAGCFVIGPKRRVKKLVRFFSPQTV